MHRVEEARQLLRVLWKLLLPSQVKQGQANPSIYLQPDELV